jgi:hypothetical protein
MQIPSSFQKCGSVAANGRELAIEEGEGKEQPSVPKIKRGL